MALLIKFAIVREIGLRHDAEQLPAMDDEGAVEQPAIQREGSADDQNRAHLIARLEDAQKLRLHGSFQRILKKQIVIRVGRNAELRKEREHRLIVMRPAREVQGLRGVCLRFRDLDARYAHRNPGKPMAINIVEHAKPLLANGCAGGALVSLVGLTNSHGSRPDHPSIHGG